MPKCPDCALLCWRPGCTDGGGDDFNTYVDLDDDSDCPSFRPAKQKLLLNELAQVLKKIWVGRFTDGNTGGQYPSGCERPGYTVMLTPEQCESIQAVLARYQKEVGDA